jgi:hypothetical protein
MSRLIVAIVPFAVLAGLPLAAAPGPKSKDSAALLMTQEGDKRVSESRSGDSLVEVAEVVTKVERTGDTVRVTTSQQVNGRAQPDLTYEASPKGVFLVAVGGKDLPAPRPYVRLPAGPDNSWTWEEGETAGRAAAKHTRTAARWEEVEVPAGKFHALRVESKLESPGVSTLTGTYWFAPGVGEVKAVIRTSTGEQTTELKSFKTAK